MKNSFLRPFHLFFVFLVSAAAAYGQGTDSFPYGVPYGPVIPALGRPDYTVDTSYMASNGIQTWANGTWTEVYVGKYTVQVGTYPSYNATIPSNYIKGELIMRPVAWAGPDVTNASQIGAVSYWTFNSVNDAGGWLFFQDGSGNFISFNATWNAAGIGENATVVRIGNFGGSGNPFGVEIISRGKPFNTNTEQMVRLFNIPSSAGITTWNLVAWDPSLSDDSPGNVLVDYRYNNAPTVTLTNNSTLYNSQAFPIQATAVDQESNLVQMSWYYRTQAAGNSTWSNWTKYSGNWTTTAVQDGIALDPYGNISATSSKSFTASSKGVTIGMSVEFMVIAFDSDNIGGYQANYTTNDPAFSNYLLGMNTTAAFTVYPAPPVVTLGTPTGSFVPNGVITVPITSITDPAGALQTVVVQANLNGAGWTTFQTYTLGSGFTNGSSSGALSATYTIPYTASLNATLQFQVVATDASGQSGTADTTTFNVTDTAPTLANAALTAPSAQLVLADRTFEEQGVSATDANGVPTDNTAFQFGINVPAMATNGNLKQVTLTLTQPKIGSQGGGIIGPAVASVGNATYAYNFSLPNNLLKYEGMWNASVTVSNYSGLSSTYSTTFNVNPVYMPNRTWLKSKAIPSSATPWMQAGPAAEMDYTLRKYRVPPQSGTPTNTPYTGDP
jgi:hypothetical protein